MDKNSLNIRITCRNIALRFTLYNSGIPTQVYLCKKQG